MDKQKKRELKKLGKLLIEKRSEEFKKTIELSNPAKFASDEYMKNHAAIIMAERQLKNSPKVYTSDEIRSQFIVHTMEFDENAHYPYGSLDYWECRICGNFVPTLFDKYMECECGNIVAKLPYIYFEDSGYIRLVRLIGKANSNTHRNRWWQFWKK